MTTYYVINTNKSHTYPFNLSLIEKTDDLQKALIKASEFGYGSYATSIKILKEITITSKEDESERD